VRLSSISRKLVNIKVNSLLSRRQMNCRQRPQLNLMGKYNV